MDNREFGTKIRTLREEKNLTREDFCGDETELSVRQLARIEMGTSAPNLTKVRYIADRLGVRVSMLTDNESFELPIRYKELKYQILRTPTYLDRAKISVREQQFEEIAEQFYDDLPEDEKLTIDALQSMTDIVVTKEIDFGTGLLHEYFEQIKAKNQYSLNDLILINLYLVCLEVSNFKLEFYDDEFQEQVTKKLLSNLDAYSTEELFVLNQALITLFGFTLSEQSFEHTENILSTSKKVMERIHDFQRMPILSLMEWKYALFHLHDKERAEQCYEKSLLYSELMGDPKLEGSLREEWSKDISLAK